MDSLVILWLTQDSKHASENSLGWHIETKPWNCIKKSDSKEHKKSDKQHTIHGTLLLPNGMTQEVTFWSFFPAESNCQNAASTNPTFLQYAAFIPSFMNNLT